MFVELPTLEDGQITVNTINVIDIRERGASECVLFLRERNSGVRILMSRAELTSKLNEALKPK